MAPTALPAGIARPSSGSQKLAAALAIEVRRITDLRELTVGAVMREIGRSSFDTSLGMALSRGTLVRGDLVGALEQWVQANTGR